MLNCLSLDKLFKYLFHCRPVLMFFCGDVGLLEKQLLEESKLLTVSCSLLIKSQMMLTSKLFFSRHACCSSPYLSKYLMNSAVQLTLMVPVHALFWQNLSPKAQSCSVSHLHKEMTQYSRSLGCKPVNSKCWNVKLLWLPLKLTCHPCLLREVSLGP